ncbi:aldo/keto reductase [Candidatus Bathyarchaeota archaeon]|nr:MAG: aldo/keto reductase [Candidatus Bathyarchaeota archaeon]
MKYRKLGRTGLRVPEIGFGCGNIGGLIIRGSHEEQIEAVNLALDLGIDYFDTAPSYGNGKSEENLGKVLAELEPEIVLASKVGLSLDQLDNITEAVERSVEASLDRLQRDHVDVLQLHSRIALSRDSPQWRGSLSVDDVLGENGVADAFDDMRRMGKTRFIGFTGIGEAAALHRVVESRRFDVVQAYFNLLNPSAGYPVSPDFNGYDFKQLIDAANKNGMGVAAIRVMAAGALGGEASRMGYAAPTVGNPMVSGGEYERDEDRASRLGFLLAGSRSLPQAALQFVLTHRGVSMALVGFSNLVQIREAVESTNLGPIPDSDLKKLRKFWGQVKG